MKPLALVCLTLLGLTANPASADKKHAPHNGGHHSAPVVVHQPIQHHHKPGLSVTIGTPQLQVSLGHGGLGVQAQFGGYCPPKPAPVWVPGQWVSERQRVWVPGSCVQVWREPIYQTHYNHCGQPYQVLVRPGFYETVQQPGHFEVQLTQVWRPGYWHNGC